MDMNSYFPQLEASLTPARLRHSLGVMQVMGELAPVYELNREQAMIAGLLHDAAKDFSPEQQEASGSAAIRMGERVVHSFRLSRSSQFRLDRRAADATAGSRRCFPE
jgi:HD superfamily phosphohydrolase YqeK